MFVRQNKASVAWLNEINGNSRQLPSNFLFFLPVTWPKLLKMTSKKNGDCERRLRLPTTKKGNELRVELVVKLEEGNNLATEWWWRPPPKTVYNLLNARSCGNVCQPRLLSLLLLLPLWQLSSCLLNYFLVLFGRAGDRVRAIQMDKCFIPITRHQTGI